MKSIVSKSMAALAAVAFTAMIGAGAMAQEKPATTPKTTKTTKAPSACKGLVETACTAKAAECSWVKESKDAKSGKVKRKAYCRAKPAPKAKPKTK